MTVIYGNSIVAYFLSILTPCMICKGCSGLSRGWHCLNDIAQAYGSSERVTSFGWCHY